MLENTILTALLTASIIIVAIFPSIYWIIVYPVIFFGAYYAFKTTKQQAKGEVQKANKDLKKEDQSPTITNRIPFSNNSEKERLSLDQKFLSSVRFNECTINSLQKMLKKGVNLDFIVAVNESQYSNDEVDSETSSQFEMTALHYAVENNNEAVVSWLLANGANSGVQSKANRFTPLHLAVANENYNIVKAILSQNNQNIAAKDIMGNTPIVYTVLSGNIALFQLLRQALATTQQLQLLEECNVYGLTPLHTAVAKSNAEMVNLLLAAGVNVNQLGKGKFTALHSAVATGDARIIQLLLKAGADVEQTNEFGWTALHYAVERGFDDIVIYLIKRCHANIEAKDKFGLTALLLSAVYGEYDIFECLLQHQANSSVLTKNGETIRDLLESTNLPYLRKVCKFNITSPLGNHRLSNSGDEINVENGDDSAEEEEDNHSESPQRQKDEIQQMIALTLQSTIFRIQTQKKIPQFLSSLKEYEKKLRVSKQINDIDE